jgi:hypothetical protein
MQKGELYPELVDYIYDYCWNKVWPGMSGLHKHAIGMQVMRQTHWGLAINDEARSFFIDGKIIKSEEDLDDLMQKGMDGFKREVVSRIWFSYDGDLELNCCPQCGKIARTPSAKQCRFCFYKWHNKQ